MRRRVFAVLGATAALIALGVGAFLYIPKARTSARDNSIPTDGSVPSGAQIVAEAPYEPPETITVGSYNIQSFGRTKLERPNTLAALAEIGSRFDVLVLQEVGSNASTAGEEICEEVMSTYVRRINEVADEGEYAYVRSNQFGIIYRSDLFELLSWFGYSGGRPFSYPPLAAHLRVRGAPLDFVAVSVHVRPSLAASEVVSLRTVSAELSEHFDERDVVILGDFNADGSYYDEGEGAVLAGFPEVEFFTVVPNDADTTVGEDRYAYDRIQLSAAMSEDWSRAWAVLRPADIVDVTLCEGPAGRAGTEAALSDHYPISAEFWTLRDDD